MSKNLKIYSVALLSIGLLVGCGSSNSSSNTTTIKKVSQDLTNFSDAEKLAYVKDNCLALNSFSLYYGYDIVRKVSY